MRQYYFIYKNSPEENIYRYTIIKAKDIAEASQELLRKFPEGIFAVVYDKSITKLPDYE